MEANPWYKTRGAIIAVAVAFVLGLAVGSSDTSLESTDNSSVNATDVNETPEVKEAVKAEEFKPVTLSGVGQQSTDKFTLKKGLYKAKLTHDGSRHFGVTVLDDNGEWVELLANDAGVFDGSKALKIDRDGQYLLDVSADGNWTVEITK